MGLTAWLTQNGSLWEQPGTINEHYGGQSRTARAQFGGNPETPTIMWRVIWDIWVSKCCDEKYGEKMPVSDIHESIRIYSSPTFWSYWLSILLVFLKTQIGTK